MVLSNYVVRDGEGLVGCIASPVSAKERGCHEKHGKDQIDSNCASQRR